MDHYSTLIIFVQMLKHYSIWKQILVLYPNFHLLVDLVEDVIQLGPLWTHSCFLFENANQFLLKLFHGTHDILKQIVSAVSMWLKTSPISLLTACQILKRTILISLVGQ